MYCLCMSRTAPEVTSEAAERISELSFVPWVKSNKEWLVVGFGKFDGSVERSEVDSVAESVSDRLSRESVESLPREELEKIGLNPPENLEYEVYFLKPSHY